MSSGDEFRQGNLVIANGRLHVGRESVPLVNIESVTQRIAHQPRRHWTAIMVAAGLLFLVGLRYSTERWGWAVLCAGLLLGAWNWFFHRKRIWIIRLNLLLNQRIQIVFDDRADSDSFVSVLTKAKAGHLPVMRA